MNPALPPITAHTDWCAHGHSCGRSEHRSTPMRIDTAWGGLIGTLVGNPSGRAYLELRVIVHIPDHEPDARLRAQQLTHALDDAFTTHLAGPARHALAGDPLPAIAAGRPRKDQP